MIESSDSARFAIASFLCFSFTFSQTAAVSICGSRINSLDKIASNDFEQSSKGDVE